MRHSISQQLKLNEQQMREAVSCNLTVRRTLIFSELGASYRLRSTIPMTYAYILCLFAQFSVVELNSSGPLPKHTEA